MSVHPSASLGAGVRLGRDVEIGPMAVVGAETDIGDGAVIGASAVVGFASRGSAGKPTLVGAGAVVEPGAIVAAGVTLGPGCVVRHGALVEQDVPANAIVSARPARLDGYVLKGGAAEAGARAPSTGRVSRGGLVELPEVHDLRGSLMYGEFPTHLPFVPKRVFAVYDVPSRKARGEHAHRVCHQLLVCVSGSCHVLMDDGEAREEFVLDRPSLALHVPPMIWAAQFRYSRRGVLLVLASEAYDPADYIRDYDEFLKARRER